MDAPAFRRRSRYSIARVPERQWLPFSTFEAPQPGKPASEDALVVEQLDDRLRLAIIDGLTPTPSTPRSGRHSGAFLAAQVVQQELVAPPIVDVQATLERANRCLWNELGPIVLSPRSRPQVAVTVVDVVERDHQLVLDAASCLDTELWVSERAGDWRQAFPFAYDIDAYGRWQDYLQHHVAPRQEAIRAARGTAPPDDLRREEAQLLADSQGMEDEIFGVPEAFVSTPIGRFAEPRVQRIAVSLPLDGAFILSTDGARLEALLRGVGPERRLRDWLEGRQGDRSTETDGRRSVKSADDIAVITIGHRVSLDPSRSLLP